MSKVKKSLPILGTGPLFVIPCLILTVCGLVLSHIGLLDGGAMTRLKPIFIILGTWFILQGLSLWVSSVLLQKITSEIKKGRLVTTGVYAWVRHPIYSAFLFVFSGILCLAANFYLLLLPLFFWAFLTILMKQTEEKWLRKKFGKAYENYCQKVNRVIPWFPR